jgi:hypothetical protein
MHLIERLNFDRTPCSVNPDRLIGRVDQSGSVIGGYSLPGRRFQAITEAGANTGHRFGIGVDRNALALGQRKAAQIVNPVHMICMRMGVKHSIDLVHLVGDHLLAEIRSGVDHNCRFAAIGADLPDQERRAGPPVFGFAGSQAPQSPFTRGTPGEEAQPRTVNWRRTGTVTAAASSNNNGKRSRS